jgi:hypothetical protein
MLAQMLGHQWVPSLPRSSQHSQIPNVFDVAHSLQRKFLADSERTLGMPATRPRSVVVLEVDMVWKQSSAFPNSWREVEETPRVLVVIRLVSWPPWSGSDRTSADSHSVADSSQHEGYG